MKGANRSKTFAAGVWRSVRYLTEVARDKPIDAFLRTDLNALRDDLQDRGLSSESNCMSSRVFQSRSVKEAIRTILKA